MSPLTPEQILEFEEQGCLVVRGLLDVNTVIAPLIAEYEALLDRLCEEMVAAGKLSSTYADLPFSDRLIRVYTETGENFAQPFDISLPQGGVQADTPIHLGPAVFNLLTNERLLDVVEQIIGPEILSNPVQHVRIKPPQRYTQQGVNALVGSTSWHQDQGVVLPEADDSMILTVWLPVTQATVENGCLAAIPGSHREGLTTHCRADTKIADLHIPAKFIEAEAIVPLPMEPGDVLFMHRRTKHSSLTNNSDAIRWSFDLRYNPIGQPTGRPAFPEFVARSAEHPEQVITGRDEWEALWHAARARLAGVETAPFNRWREDAAVCA